MTEIRLHSRRILFFLAVAIAFFTAAGVGVQWSKYQWGHGNLFGLHGLFDLDEETNIPSWFESLLFFFSALQLFWIACAKKKSSDRWAPYWRFLGILFVLFSLDEIVSIHETSILPLRQFLHIRGGFLYFSWVILGAAFVLILGTVYLRFFIQLPGSVRRDFVISAVIFLGGALVVEAAGGRYAALHGQDNLPYELIASLEEMMEMAGLWYWIRTLFIVIREHSSFQSLTIT